MNKNNHYKEKLDAFVKLQDIPLVVLSIHNGVQDGMKDLVALKSPFLEEGVRILLSVAEDADGNLVWTNIHGEIIDIKPWLIFVPQKDENNTPNNSQYYLEVIGKVSDDFFRTINGRNWTR